MKRFLAVTALVLAPLAYAQPLKLAVFDRLKDKASDNTDINLNKDVIGMGLGFLGGAKDGDAAQAKSVLGGLRNIQVKSLEFEKEGEYTDADVQALLAELAGPGWNLIVRVEENKGKKNQEISRIWIKAATETESGGLRIMTAEPKELTVVVIEGRIRLEDLKNLEGVLPSIHLPDNNEGSSKKKEDE
jgi:hypothetical protein